MKLVQAVLIVSLLLSIWTYFRVLRSRLWDRLMALGLFLAGIFLSLFPDTSTVAANVLGVGRGTDLVFYLFIIAVIFLMILMYSRIMNLEARQTEIIRYAALAEAKKNSREKKSQDWRPN